jgi:hypothetical protein
MEPSFHPAFQRFAAVEVPRRIPGWVKNWL